MESYLECVKCGRTFDPDIIYNCPQCGGIIDVIYDYNSIARKGNSKQALQNLHSSILGYTDFLPLNNSSMKKISLGEGGTSLIKCPQLCQEFEIDELYLKNETTNPTGSFKDRPVSVAVNKAKEIGVSKVITASSGNAGSSVAAYTALAGIEPVILIPSDTSLEKVIQMYNCGAKVIKVKGDYSVCFKLAKEATAKFQWFNVTSTFLNPYATEGDKTVGYEIYQQLGGRTPDWILIPIGAGPLLYGCYKGFRELKKLDLVSHLPSMAGIQAEGCAPITQAFEQGKSMVKAWGSPSTIASGIADPLQGYTQDGTLTLQTILESEGAAVAVEEKKVLEGVKLLARESGIFAEPTGAISVPGLKKLVDKGYIKNDDLVICVITGSGFKDTRTLSRYVDIRKEIEPKIGKLEKALNKI